MFLSSPEVPTFKAPALLVIVIVPLGLETSPLILIPPVPLFVIVVVLLLVAKFLIAPPSATVVPLEDVIVISPLLFAKALPIVMLSVLTN